MLVLLCDHYILYVDKMPLLTPITEGNIMKFDVARASTSKYRRCFFLLLQLFL